MVWIWTSKIFLKDLKEEVHEDFENLVCWKRLSSDEIRKKVNRDQMFQVHVIGQNHKELKKNT